MKKILCYTICLLLAACGPRVSETTLIRGRVEGGTADRASVYVLDYDINEPIGLAEGGFTYELPTNKAEFEECLIAFRDLTVRVCYFL